MSDTTNNNLRDFETAFPSLQKKLAAIQLIEIAAEAHFLYEELDEMLMLEPDTACKEHMYLSRRYSKARLCEHNGLTCVSVRCKQD